MTALAALLVTLLPVVPPVVSPGVPPSEVPAGGLERRADAPPLSRPVSLLPRAVTSFGAAACDGWLYVLGGYHGTPHAYARDGQAAEFYRVNLLAPADLELLPSPGAVQSVALVAHEGRLWRVGGMRIDNEAGAPVDMHSLERVEVFDPRVGSWTLAPSLPTPRSSHMAAVVAGRLYAVGGWQLDGDSETGTFHEHMDVLALDALRRDGATDASGGGEAGDALDAGSAAWERVPMPFARRAFGLAATADHLVVVGGMTPDGPTDAVEVLDARSGAWTRGPDFPGGGFAAAAVAVGDAVVASGKEGTLWSWRVGEPAWRVAGRHAFARFFHQLVACEGGRVVTLGGIGGMDAAGRMRHVESFDAAHLLAAPAAVTGDETAGAAGAAAAGAGVAAAAAIADDAATAAAADDAGSAAPSPDERITVWTIPNATAAKNRQGLALVGRELLLFGGNRSLGQHDFEREHFLDEAVSLSLVNLGFTPLPVFPVVRQSMVAEVSADLGRVFVVGGFGHDGEVARAWPDTFVLDLDARAWTPGPAMPVPRTQFGIGQLDGVVHVLGGLDYDPRRATNAERFDHLTSIVTWDSRDPAAGWETLDVALPATRRAFAYATLGDDLVVVGGMREDFELVEDAFAFDMRTHAITPFPMASAPRLSAEMVELDGRLYIAGGSSPDATGELVSNRSIEVYDPQTGAWTPLIDELPFETRHMRMLAFDHQLLVYTAHVAEHDAVTLALIDPRAP